MDFEYSPKVQELRKRLIAFMEEHIYPNDHKWWEHVKGEKRWEPVPIIEELKPKARGSLRDLILHFDRWRAQELVERFGPGRVVHLGGLGEHAVQIEEASANRIR